LATTILGVEASVFAHATEDEAKVERALKNALTVEADSGIEIRKLSGHYNDPLSLIAIRVTDRKAAHEVFVNVVRALSTMDRERLLSEIEDRVDDSGNLYLRLDKQSAFVDRMVLQEIDPIRLKFKFRVPHGADPKLNIRSYIASVLDEIEGVAA
jgi:hypothetical protein